MASGAVHYRNNKRIATFELSVCVIYAISNSTAAPVINCTIGSLLGLLATPDLDLPSASYTEWLFEHYVANFSRVFGVPKKTAYGLGRTVKKVVMALTGPYAFLIPHRHWLSHGPIIGTLLRALYFYSIYWAVVAFYFYWNYWLYNIVVNYPIIPLREILSHNNTMMVLIIWETHNLMHLIDDGCMIQSGGILNDKGKKIYLLGKRFYHFIHKRTDKAAKKLKEQRK